MRGMISSASSHCSLSVFRSHSKARCSTCDDDLPVPQLTRPPERMSSVAIRIAERIATLDILSGGRVSWGTGKSSSQVEQRAFECDLKTLNEQWLEALEIIPRMWRDDVFSYKGRFFD